MILLPTFFEIRENFVGGHFANEKEKYGIPCIKTCSNLSHEPVVNSDIDERSAECSGSCTKGGTRKGHKEDHAHEQSPETT